MATLDTSIILQGRTPNILGAMAQGMQLRAARDEMARGNALQQLYAQQGAGLMAGEEGAYNALAALDPVQAMNLRSGYQGQQATAQGMAQADERLEMDRETMRMRVEELTRTASREEIEAEAADAARKAQGMMAAYMQGPEAFAQAGFDVPYEQVPQVYAQATGALDVVAEVLAGQQPQAPTYEVVSGLGVVNMDAPGGPEVALPVPAQGPSTVVNVGGEEVPGDGKLRDELMKKEGELWSDYLRQGATSAGMAQDLEALGQIAALAPQGPIAGRLAQLVPGASTAGAAFQSIVARVAPGLRVEGSGATSDIEYNGFLQSMPSLINYPEANRVIMSVLMAKAQVNADRAAVVNAYQNGELDHATARRQIAEIDARSILTPEMKAALEGLEGEAEAPENGLQMAPDAPPAGGSANLSDDDLLRMYGGQ